MSTSLELAVHGAAGRMGRRVVALAAEDPDFRIVSAIDHASNPLLGQDAGSIAGLAPIDVPLSDHWPASAQVVIDFSLPEAVDECLAKCVAANFPLVIATTGLSETQKTAFSEAAKSIPI